MNHPDFIEVYPAAISQADCARAIQQFLASKQAVRGSTGSGVDLKLKDSWDIDITNGPEWQWLKNLIETAALNGVCAYLRKYPYTVLAPLALKRQDAQTGELIAISADDLGLLNAQNLQSVVTHSFRPGTINLQRYIADQGGYPYWHCEHYPKPDTAEPLGRVLLYSIYLNEGFSAGETEFFHQQRKIAPRTGDLLIAPAFFTHTHRGNRPIGGDKYIATSWILYQHAEKLFGTAINAGQR
jgi:hypothetical protein